MILVDANILLDIFTDDPQWKEWSTIHLQSAMLSEGAAINPIIYAEVSLAFERQAELDENLHLLLVQKLKLPYEAAFIAGKAFLRYRRSDGKKRSPLPDFYIGAHAAVSGLTLLTRDASRYRTYFHKVQLITPGKAS
jgi:predicted nucleic acid-binding protein